MPTAATASASASYQKRKRTPRDEPEPELEPLLTVTEFDPCVFLALLLPGVACLMFLFTSVATNLAASITLSLSSLISFLSFLGLSVSLCESCIYLLLHCCLESSGDKEFFDFCVLCLVPMMTKLLPISFDFIFRISIVTLTTGSILTFMGLRGMSKRVTVVVASAIVSAISMWFEGVAGDTFLAVVLLTLWFKFKTLTRTQPEDTDRCRPTLKYSHFFGDLKRKIEEETGQRVSESDGKLEINAKCVTNLELEEYLQKLDSIVAREFEGRIDRLRAITTTTTVKDYGGFVEFNGSQQGLLESDPVPVIRGSEPLPLREMSLNVRG